MYICDKFSQRVKSVRLAHSLSYQEVADILGLTKTTYRTWEVSTSAPSLEILDLVCKLFAVSSDWLLGYSNKIYNEDFILNLEQNLIPSQIAVSENSKIYSFNYHGFSEAYRDENLRKKNFSLAIRANIIYCLNINRAFLEYAYMLQSGTEYAHIQPYFPKLEDKAVYNKREKLKDEYTDYMIKLWNQSLTEPVFKIPEDI